MEKVYTKSIMIRNDVSPLMFKDYIKYLSSYNHILVPFVNPKNYDSNEAYELLNSIIWKFIIFKFPKCIDTLLRLHSERYIIASVEINPDLTITFFNPNWHNLKTVQKPHKIILNEILNISVLRQHFNVLLFYDKTYDSKMSFGLNLSKYNLHNNKYLKILNKSMPYSPIEKYFFITIAYITDSEALCRLNIESRV